MEVKIRIKKILGYEKIFNITENTILPALKQYYIRWRSYAYRDFTREFKNIKDTRDENLINVLKKNIILENYLYLLL